MSQRKQCFRLTRERDGLNYKYDVYAPDVEAANALLDQREKDTAGRYDFMTMLEEFPYLKDIICIPFDKMP